MPKQGEGDTVFLPDAKLQFGQSGVLESGGDDAFLRGFICADKLFPRVLWVS